MGCSSGHECPSCGRCMRCVSHQPGCPWPDYENAMREWQRRRRDFIEKETLPQVVTLRDCEREAGDLFDGRNPPPKRPGE